MNYLTIGRWQKILITCMTIIVIIATFNSYQNRHKMTNIYSIYHILSDYGFSSPKQKQALEELMRQAAIISPSQSLQDKFPNRATYQELAQDILEFVNLTQQYFTIRAGYQERWEIKPPSWMLKNQAANFERLKILGMVDAKKPINSRPDAICILGAIMNRIEDRINYASLMIDNGLQSNNLILLAGERIVTLGIDGSEEELKKIANHQLIPNISKLTETHLQ